MALFVGSAGASTAVPAGTISADQTWTTAGSPYLVQGNITVGATATLSIAAGTAVVFEGNYSVQVLGGLQVAGTVANPASFAPNTSVSRWLGINLNGSALPVNIANASLSSVAVGLRVFAPSAAVSLSDVAFSYASPWAIDVDGARAKLSAQRITVVNSAEGLRLQNSDNFTVAQLAATNLAAPAPFGRLTFFAVNATAIRDATFSGLLLYAAGVVISSSSRVTISNVTGDRSGVSIWDAAIGISNSDNMSVSHLVLNAFDSGLSVNYGTDVIARNISVNGSSNAIVLTCACTLDNATLSNSQVGVFAVGISAGHVTVSNVSSVRNQVGFKVDIDGNPLSALEQKLDVDFRQGNSIDGVPILAYYRDTNPPPASGGPYSWLYVYGTRGAVVNGTNLTSYGLPLAVWVDSRDGALVDARLSSYGTPALAVVNVTNLTLRNVNLSTSYFYVDGYYSAGEYYGALYVQYADRLSVANSAIDGSGATAIRWGGVTNATLSNSTARRTDSNRHSSTVVVSLAGSSILIQDNSFSAPSTNVLVQVSGQGIAFLRTNFFSNGTWALQSWGGTNISVLASFVMAGIVDLLGSGSITQDSRINGVLRLSGTNSLVRHNDLTFSNIIVGGSSFVTIERNLISNSGGISVGTGSIGDITNLTIRSNVINNSGVGISFSLAAQSAYGNVIYENEFYNYSSPGNDNGRAESATWYNAQTHHGNFWDRYTGPDANGDYIGDIPYNIASSSAQDLYPLMRPWDTGAPVVSIFVPSPVDEDTSVWLDGTNSTDDRGITFAFWTVFDAAGPVNLSGLRVAYNFHTPGTYRVQFFAFDGWNQSSNRSATISVRDRTAPTLLTPLGTLVFYEDVANTIAANISDNNLTWPQGASFRWNFSGGWANLSLAFNTTAANLTVTFPEPGRYDAALNATDASGNTALFRFVVQVLDRTAPAFDLRSSNGTSADEGTNVTVWVENLTDNDPAFPGPGAVSWIVNRPGGAAANYASTSITIAFALPGDYTINVTVRDAAGNAATASLLFTAADALPPTWAAPLQLSVVAGTPFNVSAAGAYDPSGIASVTWTSNGAQLGEGADLHATFPAPGSFVLHVNVTDPFGHTSEFDIQVRAADGTAPRLVSVDFGAPRTVKQNEPVIVDAAGQFSDDDPSFPVGARYQWVSTAADARWADSRDGHAVNVSFPTVGVYDLALTLWDASLNRANMTIRVTVVDGIAPANLQWTVTPRGAVQAGTGLNLTATAVDMGPINFAWDFGDGATLTGARVAHAYASAGNYTVTLTATDNLQNAATVRFVVEVHPGPQGPSPSGGQPPAGGTPAGSGSGSAGAGSFPIVLLAAIAAAGAATAGAVVIRRRKGTANSPPAPPAGAPNTAPLSPAAESQQAAYERIYGVRPPSGPDGPPPPPVA